MAVFDYPVASELREIEQVKLPRLTADREIFKFFPIRESLDNYVAWEQEDNYAGLQQVRGLNGDPARVKPTGAKSYVMEAGVYGEYELLDERELSTRRQYGTFNVPIKIGDLVMKKQDKLLERRLNRIEWIGWTLLVTGTFSVAGPNGSIIHRDAYTTQVFSAGVTWATFATATPLANFRAVQLLGRGYSTSFGAMATAYMNQTTFNNLISNTNNADLYGRRTSGLGIINNATQLNQLLLGDNLPNIVVYDEGYFDESNVFQLFIPNGKVVLLGKRSNGAPVGEYIMTLNLNNAGRAPGAYTRVFDRSENTVPAKIEVHDGHSGGPALQFPGSIVVMSV